MKLKNIAYINYTASGGGAGKICSTLHRSFENSILYNCFEDEKKRGIIKIDNFAFRNSFHQLISKINSFVLGQKVPLIPKVTSILLNYFSEPLRSLKLLLGFEDFCFPGTSDPRSFLIREPKLVHIHNLFPDYFDFTSLKIISNKYPTLITAHDCWLMTGHCAHFFNCERYITGCGNCPDLAIPPSIKRDRTKKNLNFKKRILFDSKAYLATPSKWLKEKFLNSQVGSSFSEIRVIPNGVKTDTFFPKPDKVLLRKAYGFDEKSLIFSFVGNKTKENPWKNFKLMFETLNYFASKTSKNVLFLCIGEKGDSIMPSPFFRCQFLEPTDESSKLNDLYNCSDFYIHFSKADTFPNTILEAQSCGIPIFGNAVSGIPEQINDGETGWVLNSTTPRNLADEVRSKIASCNYDLMSKNCRKLILSRFSEEIMIENYNKYYADILEKHSSK